MACAQNAAISDTEGDAPLPTLLRGRSPQAAGKEKCAELSSNSTVGPCAQVFGAPSFSDDEDAEAELEEDGLPPNRKPEEEIMKEEAFWSKAQEALQDRDRRERLLRFMKRHRFKDVNSSSGWFWNFRFPLHAAVEDNDAEMVRILLHFKAKTKQKDAAGWSARQLARKRNVNGSHDGVLQILNEHAAARRKRAAARRQAKEAKLANTEGIVESNGPQAEKPDAPRSPEGI
ncbi:unnamed protein product [Effrenium voratum]|uniref:Ankyrin repeat-containing protein n=1 Tax=Effrenium voratum TaxID=2562239 RepID=A0AA36HTK8_9DINO|nr:unnamed protein product [Effrenium voratum]CAJ1375042.1 unnamed protein product [Effrenium voratum]CAJ1413487.1 unnamed protein product [Effrenium voratum]|eukprot:CAMPEP_0181436296 /NCGR_PEP_ID=MMETSP1110-20121109/20776_1 /TAXON_ID=174948 /ORGANISM="Symbiodinium sp., Strain CCMP421" /LENGTH=230 /DNA_ID=CAMNT_0023559859 /DNA_START=47 /DNA_END=739 /DNA_ORIENTATION=+